MPVVRWIFEDFAALEEYEFEINPREGGSPPFEKNIVYENTSAPDGKTLVFEGQDKSQTLEWTGVILTEAHYNVLYTWWAKRRQIHLTDDLGRQYWIYITNYSPKRVRSYQHPWKHEYTMRATILDWP